MAYKERKALIRRIQKARGRALICLVNFDKQSAPSLGEGVVDGSFDASVKAPLYRLLKEAKRRGDLDNGLDLLIYTRGGDVDAVWSLASLLWEFDAEFQVLVPFRCHSAGTLLTMAASRIVMCTIGELGPFDPTTANAFNPTDARGNRLGISVEDVVAFRAFLDGQVGNAAPQLFTSLLQNIHPLAIGNVHRKLQQIQELARQLLLRSGSDQDFDNIVAAFTSRFFSHLHAISRHQARDILGDRVVFPGDELETLLDMLWCTYQDDFRLDQIVSLSELMGTDASRDCRFVTSLVESARRSYLRATDLTLHQATVFPDGVTVNIPSNGRLPVVPGLPRKFSADVRSSHWEHNKAPKGITA